MEATKFLQQFIQDKSEYSLLKEDARTIQTEGMAKFIFNKLNSSKYRASALDDNYRAKVFEKIQLCVDHEIPLHIVLPFGATKNPNLPTAPGIDWAEVFNLAYVRSYLKPIAAAYRHGVIIEYISVAVFEETVNYIPQKDTDLYDEQFFKLVSYYQELFPSNLELRFSRVADLIDRAQIERLIKIKKDQLRKEWGKLSLEVRDNKLLRASRNCIIKPEAKDRERLILESALGHDAFCSEGWTFDTSPWDKKQMITLGHRYTKGWAIHFRSAPASTVNFWSGMGLLEERKDRFVPTILSPHQLQKIESQIKKIPVDFFGKEFTNLQQIGVFKNF